jgi:hypothetical protein
LTANAPCFYKNLIILQPICVHKKYQEYFAEISEFFSPKMPRISSKSHLAGMLLGWYTDKCREQVDNLFRWIFIKGTDEKANQNTEFRL